MKKIVLYILILATLWLVPAERADIAKLRPVAVIALYKENDVIILATDTDDYGTGADVMQALAQMRSTSPAIIYLDTADYLLIEEEAVGEVDALRAELKATVRLCKIAGTVDLKSAAEYLPVHGALPTLCRWKIGESLPILQTENDRLKIS